MHTNKMTNFCFILGLPIREHGSRSMRILSELAKSRLPLHGKSRFASVPCVAVEVTMLTQCDFYHVSKHDAIRAPLLLVHTCTYAIIVVSKSTAHATIFCSVENFYGNPDTIWIWQVHLGSALIWIRALV